MRALALSLVLVAQVALAAPGDFIPGNSNLPGPFVSAQACPYSNPLQCWSSGYANAFRDALNDTRSAVQTGVSTCVIPAGGSVCTTLPNYMGNPIPASQGGLGQVQPTCAAGQYIRCSGSICSCQAVVFVDPTANGSTVTPSAAGATQSYTLTFPPSPASTTLPVSMTPAGQMQLAQITGPQIATSTITNANQNFGWPGVPTDVATSAYVASLTWDAQVILTTDMSSSSGGWVDVTGLRVAVASGEVWRVEVFLPNYGAAAGYAPTIRCTSPTLSYSDSWGGGTLSNSTTIKLYEYHGVFSATAAGYVQLQFSSPMGGQLVGILKGTTFRAKRTYP